MPLDLTGWTGRLSWTTDRNGASGSVVGSVAGTVGKVTASLPASATAEPGMVRLVFWAETGTERIASPVGVVEVVSGPPAP